MEQADAAQIYSTALTNLGNTVLAVYSPADIPTRRRIKSVSKKLGLRACQFNAGLPGIDDCRSCDALKFMFAQVKQSLVGWSAPTAAG